MKSILLICAMLLGAYPLYAGEVQQDESNLQSQAIPMAEGSYLDFSKSYSYYTGTDGNKVADGTSLGNMRPDSYVVVMLDNTVENNGYTLSFQGGNKNEGGILVVNLYSTNPIGDEEATPIFTQDVTIQAMGNWNDKLPYTVTIPTSIPVGDVYMQLKASRSNSVAYAGNFDEFVMTPITTPVTYYTLTTTATPAEGGVIAGNSAEQYAQGTSVTLTATANPGYRLVKWEVGTSESTDNPLQLTINEDTAVKAVFEEIPNALQSDLSFNIADYYSTSGTVTVDTASDPATIGSSKNGSSVIYRFTSPAEGAYNVKATWGGKYDATITMNVSNDPADFDAEKAVAVALPGTGDWTTTMEATWSKFELAAATTYYLQIAFATSEAWAGNITALSLTEYKADAKRYALTTTVTPAESGTIEGNSDEDYEEGTTVALTATPAVGYRFKQWIISNMEEVSTENPVTVTIDADVTAEAVFEEIPNALQSDLSFNIADYYSASGTVTVDTASDPATIGSSKNGSSVIYRFTSPAEGAYNVKATWGGKYDATITMNVSTDPENFEGEGVSVNLAGTGDWTPSVTETWGKFSMQANVTYYLKVSFATEESWAGNINSIALENAPVSGIIDLMSEENDVEYYNLQGIRVQSENIVPGIYIKRQGKVNAKVVIR